MVVLQEFYTTKDKEYITSALQDIYPYTAEVDTWYHKHGVIVLSSLPIMKDRCGNSKFYSLKIGGTTIIPIHFNSFSPRKRLAQTNALLTVVQKLALHHVCVVGDTNLWDIAGKKKFIFKSDRDTYNLLTKYFIDCTREIGSATKVGLGFDKIFVSPDISFLHARCIRHTLKYMDHFPVFAEINT